MPQLIDVNLIATTVLGVYLLNLLLVYSFGRLSVLYGSLQKQYLRT
jgi:hypothetical protein